ncbi:MAG: lytic transglycosylase domain-containing protein [Bacteroidales bacterium]|nr:lytic transglycosylase domain-containing protein [Bacteroidales bacterium]MCF8405377.1 lytic transglycosylase domain-containing protein [Bacteroidales bacterium]
MRFCLILFLSLYLSVASGQFFSIEGFAMTASEYIPVDHPNLYYEIQIAELNKITSLSLYYDEKVQAYIHLFLNERVEDLLIFKQRSEIYFPMLEKLLHEQNIPEEIKYLAVLESGLSPTAVSPSQAVGLWQFKENTGRSFGLVIDGSTDDRNDAALSTIAACKYLNWLNSEFQDWNLSLVAYNAGPTYLRHQIRTLQTKEYFSLLPQLTPPAQNYLPALVAIIYLFNNFENHF